MFEVFNNQFWQMKSLQRLAERWTTEYSFWAAAGRMGINSVHPSICPSFHASIFPQAPVGPQAPLADPQAGPLAPLVGPQAPLAGPQTPLAGPQTPPAGPQSSWMDGIWTDGCMEGRTDGRTDRGKEFLPILQDFLPCLGCCPATL